jgi:hypothetical protein
MAIVTHTTYQPSAETRLIRAAIDQFPPPASFGLYVGSQIRNDSAPVGDVRQSQGCDPETHTRISIVPWLASRTFRFPADTP